jgi:type I restriction enzyme S subunit
MRKDWEKIKLGTLFDLYAGGDVDKSNFSPVKTPTHLYPIYSNSLQNEGLYGYTSIPKYKGNSITITGRGLVGIPMYREQPFDAIIRLLVLTPKDEKQVNGKFVSYYISRFVDFPKENTGVPQLTIPRICNIELPIPPLDEQERIVDIIETKLNAIQRAKVASNEQITNYFSLKEKLYEKVFKKYENEQVTIDSICIDISDGTHFTPTYVTNGVPFLSVKDLTKGYISFDDCRYITLEEYKKLIKRCNPQFGDVLYTKVGTTGIAKAIDTKEDFSIFVSVALLKLKKNFSSIFIEKALNLPFCKKQAEKLTQGATNKNLVIKDLKTIKLFCPEYSEQLKIVGLLEKMDDKLNRLNISLKEQSSYIDALPSSILRKAFNGEY